jgi:hypothetical protein
LLLFSGDFVVKNGFTKPQRRCAMTANELNELAGRIEGLGRALMHLVARLEDSGVIDGPDYTNGLRQSFVLKSDASLLMWSAKNAIERAADALDEARDWRRFRRQAVTPAKPVPGRPKAA